MAEQHIDSHHVEDGGKAARKDIYFMTGLLAAITTLEFIIAFIMEASGAKTGIFIVLTIVKAWGIIATFMHLKHEVKRLAWAILLPFLFIVWLLIALGKDGDSYGQNSLKDANPTRQKVEVKHHGHGDEHSTSPAHEEKQAAPAQGGGH